MQPDYVLPWARAVERILIVALGGMSLLLGWDLFRRGIDTIQSAELQGYNWTLKLSKVGPGVFFAIFATATFVYSILSPLSVSTTSRNSGTGSDTLERKESYVANQSSPSDRELVTDINTIQQLETPKDPHSEPDSAAIQTANNMLERWKKVLLFKRFGELSTRYYRVHEQVVTNPNTWSTLDEGLRKEYTEIESWDLDTFKKGGRP